MPKARAARGVVFTSLNGDAKQAESQSNHYGFASLRLCVKIETPDTTDSLFGSGSSGLGQYPDN